MVRASLKAYCGIVLNPGGLNVEYFETGVVRGVRRMLRGKTDDVRDRVPKSW